MRGPVVFIYGLEDCDTKDLYCLTGDLTSKMTTIALQQAVFYDLRYHKNVSKKKEAEILSSIPICDTGACETCRKMRVTMNENRRALQ